MENNFKDDTLSAIYNYLIEKGKVGISNDDTEAYDAAALFTIRVGNKMWSNRQHPDTDEIYLFRIYSLVEKLNSNPENRGIVEFIIGVINNVVLKECNGRDDMALKELFNGMFVESLNVGVLDKVRNDISGLLNQEYVIDELWDVNRAAIKEHDKFVRVVAAEVPNETKELMVKHSIPNLVLSTSNDPIEIDIIKLNKVEPTISNRFGSIPDIYPIPNNLPLSALIYRALDKHFIKGEDLIDTIENNMDVVRKLYQVHSEQLPPGDCTAYIVAKFVNQYILAQGMTYGPHYKPVTTNNGKIYLKWVDGNASTELDVNQLKKDTDLTGIDEELNGIQLIGSGLDGDYSEFALVVSGTYTDEDNNVWMKVFADHANSMRADVRNIHPTIIREYCNPSIAIAVKNADGKLSLAKGHYPSVYEGYRGRIGVDGITKLRDTGKLKGPFLDINGNLYYLLNVELAK